jgi:ubiquinone biosynthesis protein
VAKVTGASYEGPLTTRAARIVRVLTRHGVRDLFVPGEDEAATHARARRLRLALEELGPTFAKLGQLLSTRPDLLPQAFVEEFARLQDDVTPLSEEEAVSVMEQELGIPWEDVFDSIEAQPLAAGTIGQVHRATLENGERVVVKVQRPAAEQEILKDLGLLELLAEKTAGRAVFRRVVDIPAVVEHLSASLRRELDFALEAENVERLRAVLTPYDRLDVPRVYEALSTSRLLVLEEVQGVPVLKAADSPARREAARQLLESYYRQVLSDGFFHADPHPGNLLWWREKIYFLDLGMVGEVGPELRETLLLLLMAFWQEDVAFVADAVLLLAGEEQRPDLDIGAFEAELGELLAHYRHASLQEIQLGPVLQGITGIAAQHGVRRPASLALTGKALAQMQLAAAELDPSLDPFSVAGRFFVRLLAERVRAAANPQRVFYEARKFQVRTTRFVEAVERLSGTRPGPRLQVEFRGTDPLEETIRRAGRRLALAITAGAAILASGITAASAEAADWIPVTLAGAGGAVLVGLLVDIARTRR